MWPTVEQEQHVPDTLMGAESTDRRLLLYAYLQPREHHRTYLTTMRLFASTLLADLSAGEVAAKLAAAEREGLIDPGESRIETVIARLKQLVEWGNLVPGRREVIAASIAEFQHGSVRYQVSKLADISQQISFADDGTNTPELANKWNTKKRFLQMSVDDDKSLAVSMDVSTIGGLNIKNFADVIDWWSVMLGELNKFFKEQGAKPTT